MNTFIKNILIQTKKACGSRLALLEVASNQVNLLSYLNSFLPILQILWRNTQAPEKLLLHTPYSVEYTNTFVCQVDIHKTKI
jgi:hypothetical protein